MKQTATEPINTVPITTRDTGLLEDISFETQEKKETLEIFRYYDGKRGRAHEMTGKAEAHSERMASCLFLGKIELIVKKI